MAGKKNPAIIVAGTQSGSGKTTVTLGLLAALKASGYIVQPFKCGPDFIDPSLHRLVTNCTSRNLDLWMMGEDAVRQTFARQSMGSDISVIEGVMGMFDGRESSSAELAKSLAVPIVLVLDVRATAESAAAVLKGFETLDPEVELAGVILNRVGSKRHLNLVRESIGHHCRTEILGYLPKALDFEIPSRHLGLRMGEEGPIGSAAISELAAVVKEHVDLRRLVELAATSRARPQVDLSPAPSPTVRIGVARDAAFCFYYEDNLDLLRAAGAELVSFSPLKDRVLPEDITGLYLGGGYPELFAGELSGNSTMRRSIHDFVQQDRPVYAECGGFMYLTEGIFDNDGQMREMAGVFPVKATMQKKRAALGYREVTLQRDFYFGHAGSTLRGHEFHYSTIDEMPDHIERLYKVNNDTYEGYRYKKVLGSYMHLHFGYSTGAAAGFVNVCQE